MMIGKLCFIYIKDLLTMHQCVYVPCWFWFSHLFQNYILKIDALDDPLISFCLCLLHIKVLSFIVILLLILSWFTLLGDPKKTQHLVPWKVQRKDFTCSKQTFWKKDHSTLLLMDAKVFSTLLPHFVMMSKTPRFCSLSPQVVVFISLWIVNDLYNFLWSCC